MLNGADWLGIGASDDGSWRLPVTPAVAAGSGAIFGGCTTAAALIAASADTEHSPRWISVHFVGLARLGAEVSLRSEQLSGGRTISHFKVEGAADGKRCAVAGLAFGTRPPVLQGRFVNAPSASPPADCEEFTLPVHEGTFADRFTWRLVPPADSTGTAAWWVRARSPGADITVLAALLADYVTYGIGRAAGAPIGGLSIDNVVRFHSDPGPAHGWLLLEIRADSLDGGFGSGSAFVWDEHKALIASASQTVVLNDWDWRTPSERESAS